jgi:hypothetical protein
MRTCIVQDALPKTVTGTVLKARKLCNCNYL